MQIADTDRLGHREPCHFGPLSIVGGAVYVKGAIGMGAIRTLVGVFILWPVSGLIPMLGRGAGRRLLLAGRGLIALLMVSLLLAVWIHGSL